MAEIAVTQADRDLRDWILRRDGDLMHLTEHLDRLLARHRLTAEQAKDAEIAELTALLREARTFVMFQDHLPKAQDLDARIDTILNRERDNATG